MGVVWSQKDRKCLCKVSIDDDRSEEKYAVIYLEEGNQIKKLQV